MNCELGTSCKLAPAGGVNLLRINKNIEAKPKLLLNPHFPTLKKEIIHLFIVSLPKVPEF